MRIYALYNWQQRTVNSENKTTTQIYHPQPQRSKKIYSQTETTAFQSSNLVVCYAYKNRT